MPDERDYLKMLQRARALMEQQQWGKARQVLRQVLTAEPPPQIEKVAREMDDDCRTRQDDRAGQEAGRKLAGQADALIREAEEKLRRAPKNAEALYNESLQKLERLFGPGRAGDVLLRKKLDLLRVFGKFDEREIALPQTTVTNLVALFHESGRAAGLEGFIVIFNRPLGRKGAFWVELTCDETLIAALEEVEQYTARIVDIREVHHSNYFNTPTDNWMRYTPHRLHVQGTPDFVNLCVRIAKTFK